MAVRYLEPEPFNAALLRVVPSVWRFSVALTKNRDDADDLTQATVVRAIERREQFDRDTHLGAWCKTICRSIWLNQMRAAKLRQAQALDTVPEALLADLAANAETNIFAVQVFNEIMNLPEAQRETVVLVYAEGYKYVETAEILGVPIGTVMSRLAAARAKLGWMRPEDVAQRKEV